MAPRRKGPRKRHQSGSRTLVMATSVAVVIIFTLCLCAFNFDLNGKKEYNEKAWPRKKCRFCSVVHGASTLVGVWPRAGLWGWRRRLPIPLPRWRGWLLCAQDARPSAPCRRLP